MSDLDTDIAAMKENPEKIEFDQVMQLITRHYDYTPARFSNGSNSDTEDKLINDAGKNEGSCKIFAFALNQQFDEQLTLHCFGRYYREDVLTFPEKDDHANIRTFIKYGWPGISFESSALKIRA
jgi:hypothetical protein